jgi:hypothetical protein
LLHGLCLCRVDGEATAEEGHPENIWLQGNHANEPDVPLNDEIC